MGQRETGKRKIENGTSEEVVYISFPGNVFLASGQRAGSVFMVMNRDQGDYDPAAFNAVVTSLRFL